MTRRSAVAVLALVIAALIGVGLLIVPASPLHQTATLGLDLQGGLEVTLQAVPPKDRKLSKEDLDRSVEIMRSRVDRLGVAEPEIRTQGNNQIAIQLPGVKDPAAAAAIIGKTAQLELFDLETSLTGPSIDAQGNPVAIPRLYPLLARVQSLAGQGKSDEWYVFNAKKRLVSGPAATRALALKPYGRHVAEGVQGVRRTRRHRRGPLRRVVGHLPGTAPGGRGWYLFKYDPPKVPQMTGADLKLSGTRADFDTSAIGGGQPIVTMEFTGKGADKFQDITRDEWLRGRIRQQAQHFAIVLDREIRTWPQIDYTEGSLSSGIGGGRAQIEGVGSIGEAKEIAIVLQTGALPVKFETLDQTNISATLGKDSLAEAKKAALVGLLAVALFLLLFYRFLGLVAVLGLFVYAALLYAAVLLFNVTLTLPGIAGLVLTLGVAADANVVIFERIKEEARAGRSVRAAISTGYSKGFATIVDANVVTMITALVLFAVATASVRGFALMLLVGTAISMLTAVLATRAFLAFLAGFKVLDDARLVGTSGGGIPSWMRLDYIGRRNTWFAISAAVVVLSIGAIAVNHLNLGHRLQGRHADHVQDGGTRLARAGAGRDGADRRGEGGHPGSWRVDGRQVRKLPDPYRDAHAGGERTAAGRPGESVDASSFGAKNVSESFGRKIARSAVLAIIVSLLLIVGYISVRFQWQFAVPVMVALAHDVIITIGIYALLGREVTTATVAAVLTVLGYSIYDTIIIFDRIRENIPLMKRASFRVLANVSLWETIPRSLATTFITLVPILSLLLFGGDTLKDFAFALLIGIGSGAYSSIFVAAPLLAAIKQREPEYASRRDDLSDVQSVGGALAGGPDVGPDEGGQPAVPSRGPSPTPAPATAGADLHASSAKRERRRQRRSSRPHGRSR